jgi:hypothetical protein
MLNAFSQQAFGVQGWPSGIVVQVLSPNSDTSISDWTNQTGSGTNIYLSIDEQPYSDADYIQSPAPPNSSVARFSLSDPTAGTALGDPVTISYRFAAGAAGYTLTVSLKQGTTLITSWVHSGAGITSSFQTATQTLTSTDLAAITDFTNLFIEFQAS